MYQAGFGGTNWLKLPGSKPGARPTYLSGAAKVIKNGKNRHFGVEGKYWGGWDLFLCFDGSFASCYGWGILRLRAALKA